MAQMVVSKNEGTPIYTPIYYNPYYGDPPKREPIIRETLNPKIVVSIFFSIIPK